MLNLIYIIRFANIPILDFTNSKAFLSIEILVNTVIETIQIMIFENISKLFLSNTIQVEIPIII